ncbi:MAG: hypothetical protein A2Y17_10535 [Clostridiales bacterium GWF2_38_85]|nr:MAG: hypothetical protein A2Y17_10535 [Clostridiales bacterium GWF2_38_85]HBL84614.1 polyprenyl synthetase family protein [Clostridiales bacterium]
MTEKITMSEQTKINLNQAFELVKHEIQQKLKAAPAVIKAQTLHLAKTSGKNIRAKALIACSANTDGMTTQDAVHAAAAVELLHLATLVHDDIIDNANKRRGIEALHKKYGKKTAVLCGDYLMCLALQLASSVQVRVVEDRIDNLLPGYLTEICLGELRQNKNNKNYRLSENEYFKTISGKTAALFQASFYIGFVLSGEPEQNKKSYTDIGRYIGLIFQLADDCMDYEATQKVSKKPVLSDYRQGVITLPLIYALKKDISLNGKVEGGIEPKALKAAVKIAGGLNYTHSIIDKYYNKAKTLIENLDTNADKKENMLLLLNKSTGK